MSIPSVCRLVWRASSAEGLAVFLESLFGWQFEQCGENFLVTNNDHGGGIWITEVANLQPGNSQIIQIAVDNLPEYVEKVEQLGGRVLCRAAHLPGIGFFADVCDPDGTVFSLVKAD